MRDHHGHLTARYGLVVRAEETPGDGHLIPGLFLIRGICGCIRPVGAAAIPSASKAVIMEKAASRQSWSEGFGPRLIA